MPLEIKKVENGILTCLYHEFKYRLAKEQCLTALEISLEAYSVKQYGYRVLVQVSSEK
ncbi:hypothetical protein ETSB_0438 [cyanobacterium endosymbiont of Epithemia turgida isolate EtSB Lake Yunoko]|nr:hypothetical protein ETSB_0438 [cyanobacterium endosymbiont of Epithemia turgida isolate EtSB Lake Yunoko]